MGSTEKALSTDIKDHDYNFNGAHLKNLRNGPFFKVELLLITEQCKVNLINVLTADT